MASDDALKQALEDQNRQEQRLEQERRAEEQQQRIQEEQTQSIETPEIVETVAELAGLEENPFEADSLADLGEELLDITAEEEYVQPPAEWETLFNASPTDQKANEVIKNKTENGSGGSFARGKAFSDDPQVSSRLREKGALSLAWQITISQQSQRLAEIQAQLSQAYKQLETQEQELAVLENELEENQTQQAEITETIEKNETEIKVLQDEQTDLKENQIPAAEEEVTRTGEVLEQIEGQANDAAQTEADARQAAGQADVTVEQAQEQHEKNLQDKATIEIDGKEYVVHEGEGFFADYYYEDENGARQELTLMQRAEALAKDKILLKEDAGELAESAETVEAAKAEQTDAATELSNASENNASLQEQKMEAEQQHAFAEGKLDRLNERYAENAGQISTLQEENVQLRQELEVLEKQEGVLENAIELKKQEIETTKEKIQELENEKLELENSSRELTAVTTGLEENTMTAAEADQTLSSLNQSQISEEYTQSKEFTPQSDNEGIITIEVDGKEYQVHDNEEMGYHYIDASNTPQELSWWQKTKVAAQDVTGGLTVEEAAEERATSLAKSDGQSVGDGELTSQNAFSGAADPNQIQPAPEQQPAPAEPTIQEQQQTIGLG